MIKPRTAPYGLITVPILLLGGLWYLYVLQSQESVQVFAASVVRDCAPWDGPAFTVSIPYEAGTIINISIYESPNIDHPARYSLPQGYSQVGQAVYFIRYSFSIPLTGKVSFPRVELGRPLEGEFDLRTESGHRLNGRFEAEWIDEIVYCG
ncbi:MAG: hypothetical protein FJZ87_08925 [Chloroflexi bacterium]|nr:hypothetical protein [Chloroflexota bacterium]